MYASRYPSRRFAMVPYEALTDSRLTPRLFLVLSALFLHSDPDGKCTPTIATLGEMLGMHPTEVSKATTALAKLGYLGKGQAGYNRPNVYTLQVPSYPDDALRSVTSKRLPDAEYKARLEAANQERLAKLVRVTHDDGEVLEMPYRELVRLSGLARQDGCESVGITRTEFRRHGIVLPND